MLRCQTWSISQPLYRHPSTWTSMAGTGRTVEPSKKSPNCVTYGRMSRMWFCYLLVGWLWMCEKQPGQLLFKKQRMIYSFIYIECPLKSEHPQNDGHWSSFASSWTPKPGNGLKILWGNFFIYTKVMENDFSYCNPLYLLGIQSLNQ